MLAHKFIFRTLIKRLEKQQINYVVYNISLLLLLVCCKQQTIMRLAEQSGSPPQKSFFCASFGLYVEPENLLLTSVCCYAHIQVYLLINNSL